MFSHGFWYLIVGPSVMLRLVEDLLRTASQQLFQHLAPLMPPRLSAAWSQADVLVDATAAALLAGEKARALLAAGAQRLRRSELAAAIDMQTSGPSQTWHAVV